MAEATRLAGTPSEKLGRRSDPPPTPAMADPSQPPGSPLFATYSTLRYSTAEQENDLQSAMVTKDANQTLQALCGNMQFVLKALDSVTKAIGNHAEGMSSQYKASALLARSIPEMQVAVDQLKWTR